MIVKDQDRAQNTLTKKARTQKSIPSGLKRHVVSSTIQLQIISFSQSLHMVRQARALSVDWVKSEPRYGEESECLEVRG
jgi:hypothetical protein